MPTSSSVHIAGQRVSWSAYTQLFTQQPQPAHLEGKSITLMTGSAQRISVRLQRATTSQATQTEPLWPENGWAAVADSGSHTFPKMRYRPHRKASKNKGFARWENDSQSSTGTRNSRNSQEHSEESQQNGLAEQHMNKTRTSEIS